MRRAFGFVVVVLLAGVAPGSAAEAATPSVTDLAWLAGHWRAAEDDAVIEEVWLPPAGTRMLGLNRTLVDGVDTAFELLRIESDADGIVYLASPGGRCPATAFRLEVLEPDRVVFANPEHDFPQQIEYRRDGNRLVARISGTRDGASRAVEWSWTLLSAPAPLSR